MTEGVMIGSNTQFSRIIGKCRDMAAGRFHRRMVRIRTEVPIISFTFDDAPRTAFTAGGKIVEAHGARATFFISLGLLGRQSICGPIATPEDLARAVAGGHELGCHTFDHLDAWETSVAVFMESVRKNGRALAEIVPGAKFRTFAYPKRGPTLSAKRVLDGSFACCRGGGQTFNAGRTDLNSLNAFFIDRRNKLEIDDVKKVVDRNASSPGWLIFATHDVAEAPSPYGCTPEFFAAVVEYAAGSGALLLPVIRAFERLRALDRGENSPRRV